MASGGSTARHRRSTTQLWQVARPTLVCGASAKRPGVEEARQPLDGHLTVTALVCIISNNVQPIC